MNQDNNPPESLINLRLEKAVRVAAEVVVQFGDVYWPIFDRLERELAVRADKSARLAKFIVED